MAVTTDTSQAPAGQDLVRTVARAYERDRYLSALLAPRAARAGLLALAAFAGEIARIPSFVDEPMMGEIRLQWWRDALVQPPEERTGHPIADALRAAVARHDLPTAQIAGLIDAHAARLDHRAPADDIELASYLARTEGVQFGLAWRVLAGPASASGTPPQALAIAAEAYGTARLLLELPGQLAESRTLIPTSRLAAAGITPDALRAGTAGDSGSRLLRQLAADTRRRLNDVRPLYRQASEPLRTALLPVALIEPYLKALERAGDDPRRIEDIAPLTRVWRLWVAHRLGRF